MNAKNIVVLGVKGTVVAFQRDTGQRLWSAQLKTTLSSSFVSVAADYTRVYAHAGGEFFCLDLFSGQRLWHDDLPGLGYGVGSVALPGVPVSPSAATVHEEKRRQESAAAASSSSAAS